MTVMNFDLEDGECEQTRTALALIVPPPLPRKKPAAFHHPTLDMPLYDGLAMDLHAITYAEPLFAEIGRLRAALLDLSVRQAAELERLDRFEDWLADRAGPLLHIDEVRKELA